MTLRTRITVTAKPPVWHGVGTWLDGRSPVPQAARLGLDDTARALKIVTDGATKSWAYDDLRALRDQAGPGGLVLARAGGGPARLILDPDDTRLIRTRARRLSRRTYPLRRGRLALLALGAVASVVLMLTFLVPALADRLATFLPPEGEAALGQATLTQIRRALDDTGVGLPICDGAAGTAALTGLRDRLAPGGPDVSVTVLDHEMINAFALPGGTVVLFRGLIDAARTPEEVAAVLAHEIGHVAARDPTRIALRSAGSIGVLGLLFGDFAGGTLVLFLTERLISADYTQEAEAGADGFAHDRLIAARMSPGAIGDFFERLQEEGAEPPPIVQHFLAHPTMQDRIAAARAAVPADLVPVPALDAEGWAALRAICD